jgi:hypothetical protein
MAAKMSTAVTSGFLKTSEIRGHENFVSLAPQLERIAGTESSLLIGMFFSACLQTSGFLIKVYRASFVGPAAKPGTLRIAMRRTFLSNPKGLRSLDLRTASRDPDVPQTDVIKPRQFGTVSHTVTPLVKTTSHPIPKRDATRTGCFCNQAHCAHGLLLMCDAATLIECH